MIVRTIFYNIKCDCCGKKLIDDDIIRPKHLVGKAMQELAVVRSSAKKAEWIEVPGLRHYCPTCTFTSDNGEVVVHDVNYDNHTDESM